MASEFKKKQFVPNKEAELAQTKRTAEEKQKSEANVQKWTKRTGSTENLIKQYGASSSNYKRIYKDKKWYSGSKPTLRETYARMYDVAGDDAEKWRGAVQMFDEEISNRGSVIYNPYAQATNTKAIDGLKNLGVDVPDTITDDWVDNMWAQYGQYARETTTGYGPGSPTTKSSRENDIAYWVNTLLEDKETTNLAEAQMQSMYGEVEYLAKQGYSDNEILKRVKANKDYNELWKMDEARLEGDAVRLNRRVNYSGDDTIYGMIWAARNDGGTGDFFIDSVQSVMGLGNQYKPDASSAAALDPSNYEGYDPYARGGTLHELNIKYGTTAFDDKWLEDHRAMLNDPEQAEDWRNIKSAVEDADNATKELAALNQWTEKQISAGKSADDIADMLSAMVKDGDELRYADPETGKYETVKLSTLSKMEDYRSDGSYLDIGYSVDFTLPGYIAGIKEKIAQRDAEAEEAEKTDEKEKANKEPNIFQRAWSWLSEQFDSEDEPEAENSDAYKTQQAYTTVFEKQPKEPREGMVDMQADLTAAIADEEAAIEPEPVSEEANTYMGMLQGGKWDGRAYSWAIQESSNPAAVEAEICQSLIDYRAKGTEMTGLAKSWWNRFGSLVDSNGAEVDWMRQYHANLGSGYDTRKVYGTQVYELLRTNDAAYEARCNEYASRWAENMLAISALTENIGSMIGTGSTDEEIDNYLQASGLQAAVDNIQSDVDSVLDAVSRERAEANRQQTIANTEVIQRVINGTVTETDIPAYTNIMTHDIRKVAAQDETYIAANDVINEALSADSIADSGIRFTFGAEADEIYGAAAAMEEGASIYSTGVTALAQNTLDTHMRYAAACGLTLEQFYEQNPSIARTPEQIVSEARGEYNSIWNGFAHTISGLMATNEKIFSTGDELESEDGAEKSEDVLSVQDSLTLAVDKLMRSNDLNWDKTMYMLKYGWKDEAKERETLLSQYGGDRTKIAEQWDKFEEEREGFLRKVYDNDITSKKNGISYEAWREGNTDPQLDEIREKRANVTDILELGDPARLDAEGDILNKSENVANVDKVVSEYGSDFDKFVYEGATSLMATGQYMYTSVVLGGGYAASLAATVTGSGGDAFDRFMQTGDYDAAMAASIGAWLVNAAIEKMSFERYVPETLGGSQGKTMQAVRGMLQREGLYSMMKNPKALSTAARAVLETLGKVGVDAAGEGLEEGLQSIVDSVADNLVYGSEVLLSGEDLKEAVKAAGAGAAMAPILSGISTSIFGRGVFVDEDGAPLSKEEAEQLPEHDGTLTNVAIEFEATNMAFANSEEELAQVAESSENAAKQAAQEEVEAAQADVETAQTRVEEAQAEHDNAAAALESVNEQMQGSDTFTEEMGKTMTEAATEVDRTREALDNAREDLSSAQAREESSRQKLEEATARVQEVYDRTVGAAKERYTQIVRDKYTGGDVDYEAYLQACGELESAKAQLLKARADDNVDASERGRALLAVDKAINAVEEAKAKLDAKFAEAAVAQAEANASELDRVEDGEIFIDDRDAEYGVKKRAVKPFYNSHRTQFGEYAKAAAEQLLSDVSESLPASVNFIPGEAVSTPRVVKTKRATSELIARYKDRYKISWGDFKKSLMDFISALDNGEAIPNTVMMKRVELMVDEMLTDGYTDIDGEYYPPSYNYQQMKSALSGKVYEKNTYRNKYGESFFDITGAGSPVTPELIEEIKAECAVIDSDARTTPDGKYILEIGDKFVYTDGDAENPSIDRIVIFDKMGIDPDIDATIKEGLYGIEESGGTPEGIERIREENFAAISSAYGTERAFRTYDLGHGERGSEVAGGAAGSEGSAIGGGIESEILAESEGRSEGSTPDIREWRDVGGVWGDHRTPAKTGEMTTADQNPIEIMRDLTRSINVGYNPGGDMSANGARVPWATMAFYNDLAKSITSRTNMAGDLAIGLHEFGHATHARLEGLHANNQLINALSPSVRALYTSAELDGEAIAEFVIDYVFNRDEAVRMAGEDFVRDFESRLEQDEELNAAITRASEQAEMWNNADIGSKTRAMIKDGEDPRRTQLGNWFSRAVRKAETTIVDVTTPADLVNRDFRNKALYTMQANGLSKVCLTDRLVDPEGRVIGKSLLERIYESGVKADQMDDVVTYMVDRYALERRDAGKDLLNENEFPTDQLTDYVASVNQNHPEVARAADAITGFWNEMLDAWGVDTGLISGADVQRMREAYKYYVPTRRVMNRGDYAQYGSSSKFRIRGAVKGGSSLEIINPIASFVRMTQSLVSTATQNRLVLDFHKEWQNGGLGWLADDVTSEMRVQHTDITAASKTLEKIRDAGGADADLLKRMEKQLARLETQVHNTGENNQPGVVSCVDESGRRYFYKINDPDLFNLLSGTAFKSGNSGAVLRSIKKFKNTFTKLTTSNNPLFAIKNAVRDFQASVNTGTHSLTYADGMVRWVRSMYELVTDTGLAPEYRAMGGGDTTRINTELNGRNEGAVSQDLVKELFNGKETKHGVKARKSALEALTTTVSAEDLNNLIEKTSRYVEYRFGKYDHSTYEGLVEAYMGSQNVTTNFGTYGSSQFVRFLTQVVPFANATIQGLNKDINLIRDLADPARRRQAAPKLGKTVMNTALTAALQYAVLKMVGGDDDDEDYALLTQEMRTGNLIIPVPKDAMQWLGDTTGFDRPYIRVPMQQGPLAQSIYALALDTVANVTDYSPMEVDMWRAAKYILQDTIPDGSIFSAASDTLNNRTWYGGNIESDYMQSYSVINRYNNDTPQAFIELGKALNVSPAKLEYLITQYSGVASKLITPLISGDEYDPDGKWTLSGAARNFANALMKDYTLDPVSSNDLSSYYASARDTIDQIVADGEAGNPMGNVAYSVDGEEAYNAAVYLSKEFKAINKEISALWSEYKDIKADSSLTIGERARQMRQLRREYIIPRQRDAIALYEEYKMKYIDADTLAMKIYGSLPGGLDHPTVD